MKKIFFSLLAIAAIASCAKTEDVFTEGDSEIKLAPVTALQTKANHLGAIDGIVYPVAENFDVYAYYKNVPAGQTFTDGQVFLTAGNSGVEFVNKGNYWGGAKNYYWPKNGSLRFAAYSPADLDVLHQQDGDLFTVNGYVQPNLTDETWDFLVAPTSPSYSLMTATEKVAIEFQHALAWITLNVKAKDADAAKAFDIKKVTINNVNTKANFAAKMGDGIQYEEWMGQNTPASYVVFEGSQRVTETSTAIESTEAGTIVIPQATTTVTVDFTQYGVNGTPDVEGMTVTLDLVLDQDNEPWRPGKHYVYNLVFGLDKILINPSVADWDDVPVGNLEADAINVSTAAQLAAALANPNATKIVFQNDIEGSFIVPEVAGRALTIDGNDYKLTGAFQIDGKSTYAGATTVYKNINFETSDVSLLYDSAFIYCGTLAGDSNVRYPDNVTIENCTFAAKGAAADDEQEKGAVAAKFWSLNGALSVENCNADALHSFMQLTSCGKAVVTVENVTVKNGRNGISLGDAGKVTISKSDIAAREYGIRANGCAADTKVVKTKIAAKQPVVVRNMTVGGYVLTVDGTDLTPATTDDYQIIFTKNSDDKAYVAPTVDYTLNAATSYKVFPTPEGWATNAEELAAALRADKENISVKLTADIDLPISSLGQITGGSGEYKLGGENTKSITIDLNGKTLNITTTYWSNLGAKNNNALFTIKNGKMTSSQATGTWNSYDLTFSNCDYEFENVEFLKAIAFDNKDRYVALKNVKINEGHDYYAMWICASGMNVNIDGLEVVSAGRGIKIDEQYVNAPSIVNLVVKNAEFNTVNKNKAAILVKTVAGANITLENVNIAGVKGDTDFAVWVDEDSAAYADKVTVNGGLCKVEGAKVAAADTDTELREALKNGNDVILTDDITTTDAESNGNGATGININGGVFDGNGHTIEVEGATGTWDSAIAITGGTIKNVTVAKGFRGIFFKKGTEKIVLENVIINGPTYTISCDEGSSQGFEAYNSKFYGWTSYAGTIGTGKFEGCTFGAGAGYNFSRPYAPTTYVNCAFEAGHKIDARAKVSFENCTLDGVALTSANINDLVTGNRQNIESVK